MQWISRARRSCILLPFCCHYPLQLYLPGRVTLISFDCVPNASFVARCQPIESIHWRAAGGPSIHSLPAGLVPCNWRLNAPACWALCATHLTLQWPGRVDPGPHTPPVTKPLRAREIDFSHWRAQVGALISAFIWCTPFGHHQVHSITRLCFVRSGQFRKLNASIPRHSRTTPPRPCRDTSHARRCERQHQLGPNDDLLVWWALAF